MLEWAGLLPTLECNLDLGLNLGLPHCRQTHYYLSHQIIQPLSLKLTNQCFTSPSCLAEAFLKKTAHLIENWDYSEKMFCWNNFDFDFLWLCNEAWDKQLGKQNLDATAKHLACGFEYYGFQSQSIILFWLGTSLFLLFNSGYPWFIAATH